MSVNRSSGSKSSILIQVTTGSKLAYWPHALKLLNWKPINSNVFHITILWWPRRVRPQRPGPKQKAASAITRPKAAHRLADSAQ